MEKYCILFFVFLTTSHVFSQPCIKRETECGYTISLEEYTDGLEHNDSTIFSGDSDVFLDKLSYIINYHRFKTTGRTEDLLSHDEVLKILRRSDPDPIKWLPDDDVCGGVYNHTKKSVDVYRRKPYEKEIGLIWEGKIIVSLADGCPMWDLRGYYIPDNPGTEDKIALVESLSLRAGSPSVKGGPFSKDDVIDLFYEKFKNAGDIIMLHGGNIAILSISKDSLTERIAELLNYYAKIDGWADFMEHPATKEDVIQILEKSEVVYHFFEKGRLEIDMVDSTGSFISYQRESYLDKDTDNNGENDSEGYLLFDPTKVFGFEKTFKKRIFLSLSDISCVKEIQ